MSEKTSMFELLNERMEKEDIVKLVCNYDNKFNELEKGLKNQLENVIKQNQMLLEKHYQQDNKIVKLIEENNYYKNQLQQKENAIKEVREDLDKQITFCINEADGTTNDKYCRITIQYLKHLKQELDKEVS